jgi:polysaccharide deacetylase family protein (PEP-CTERM system associated)
MKPRYPMSPELKEQAIPPRTGEAAPVTNSFSVDVEDYFQTEAMTCVVRREDWDRIPCRVEQNTERMLEILANHGVRSTFFFLGWVARKYPQLVRLASSMGHEIACHSYWHRLVYQLSRRVFFEDTKLAKESIEDAGGVKVIGYRAPSFSIVNAQWAYDVLAELGFRYDSSTYPVNHDIYRNPNAPRAPHTVASGDLLELPVATASLLGVNVPVGGGGYFRIMPYAYTHWGLSRLTRQGVRSILYMHPWELDPEQPRFSANRRSRFRQYTGLTSVERKLNRLLKDFRLAPIEQVFSQELAAGIVGKAHCGRESVAYVTG